MARIRMTVNYVTTLPSVYHIRNRCIAVVFTGMLVVLLAYSVAACGPRERKQAAVGGSEPLSEKRSPDKQSRDQSPSIGTATMTPDGTINLDLRAEGSGPTIYGEA